MVDSIPGRLDEITPAWLTEVVRSRSLGSADATITSRTVTVLGEGAGFLSDLARLDLIYDAGDGPASFVAKIPTSVEENRFGAEMLGVYERELRVYEEVLPDLDIPVPELFHGDIEPNQRDPERQLVLIRRAERLPVWLLRLLGRLVRRFAKPKARKSVMLMEDLAPATVGDQVKGCEVESAARVLRVAARLHASTWGDRLPEENSWLLSAGIAPKLFHAGFLDARRAFLRRADGLIGDHTRALVKRVRKEGPTRIRRIHATIPHCLLHGDLRLDNLFFDADGEVRALIDWQIVSLGPAIIDVTYFIAGSLASDTPESEIEALLTGYHADLVAEGVVDYSLDQLMDDYDETLLLILHRMASLEMLDFGDERGVALIDQWIRQLDARLARIPA